MLHHQISKTKTMGIFQNDDLVFLSEGGNLASVERVIITHEEMDKICKIWQEYKESKKKVENHRFDCKIKDCSLNDAGKCNYKKGVSWTDTLNCPNPEVW